MIGKRIQLLSNYSVVYFFSGGDAVYDVIINGISRARARTHTSSIKFLTLPNMEKCGL